VVPTTIDKRGDPEIRTDSENVTVAVKISPALERPLELPEEAVSATEATVGATRSRVKLIVAADPMFPAESVADAVTLIAPFPRVAKSAVANTTAFAIVEPETVLVISPKPEKVRLTVESTSAVTVTTPEL
jgi:hypothetical protein